MAGVAGVGGEGGLGTGGGGGGGRTSQTYRAALLWPIPSGRRNNANAARRLTATTKSTPPPAQLQPKQIAIFNHLPSHAVETLRNPTPQFQPPPPPPARPPALQSKPKCLSLNTKEISESIEGRISIEYQVCIKETHRESNRNNHQFIDPEGTSATPLPLSPFSFERPRKTHKTFDSESQTHNED